MMYTKLLNFITLLLIILLYFSLSLIGIESNINTNNIHKAKVPEKKVELKKVLEINDDSQNFYFKYPYDLKVGDDNSIYFCDSSQMLRFDRKGKMLNNYYRKGQGPGELVSIRGYFLSGDNLIILSGAPKKIMWFHKNGKHLKEFRLYQKFFSGRLINYDKKVYHIITSGIPVGKVNEWKVMDLNLELIRISSNMKMNKLITIPKKSFVYNYRGAGRGIKGIAKFVYRMHEGGKYLVFSHTEIYSITIYDIKKNIVIRKFGREYERFKDRSKDDSGLVSFDGNKFTLPENKFDSDINNIYFQNNKVLVETSRIDQEKGRLIDRFNWEDKYLDFFYLKTKGDIMLIQENFVYVKEKDEDENLFVTKYKLNII